MNNRNIYVFWTGNNQMSENRNECLKELIKVSKCNVILVKPEMLNKYILDEHPLHPSFNYLSETHKADYLRTYFMRFHGGGYSDIKKTTESSYTGLGLYGVAGWQGYEGYYFTIGLKLGTSLKSSVNDKTHSVIDYSNHKSIGINDFNNGKNISGGELLFGWIF